MSLFTKTLTPEQQSALAKFQAFAGQRAASTSTSTSTPQTQGVASLDTQLNPFLQNIQSSIGAYIDPIEGKDYTDRLAPYLAKQLTDLGITDFGDVEKRVIPAKQAETRGSGFLSNQALNQFIASRFDKDYTEQTKYYNKATGQEIDPVLFDDKAGTKYVLTEQGIQKQFDPSTRFAAQLTAYVDPSSTGGAWGTKGGKNSPPGFGPEGMMRQIASRVQGATGVDDINDLELKTVTKPRGVAVGADSSGRFYVNEGGENRYLTDEEAKTIRSEDYVYGDNMSGTNFYAEVTLPTKGIYNKKTGQLIADEGSSSFWSLGSTSGPRIDLGGWGEGPGITYASMTFDDKGKPKISTYGEDTNTLSQFQPIMTLASIIPSPIQPFAIAANAANAAYNYGNFIPAIMAALPYTGILDSVAGTASNVAGPAGEFASNSGIAGLAQNLGVSADLANTIGKVGTQSLLSGTLSAAQGKGFLPGAKSGVVSGLVNEGVNAGVNAVAPDALKGLGSLATPAKSLISSMLIAKAMNRPFDIGEAVKGAAINYGLNRAIGAGGKELGIDPKQQAALIKFYNFAAPMIAAQRRKP